MAGKSTKRSKLEVARDRVERDAQSLKLDELETPNVDIPRVVDMVLAHLPGIFDAFGDYSRLAAFDRELVEKTEDRGLALLYAHAKCTAPGYDTIRLDDLDSDVAKRRSILHCETKTLIARDILDSKCLDGLVGANGFRNNAQDLISRPCSRATSTKSPRHCSPWTPYGQSHVPI